MICPNKAFGEYNYQVINIKLDKIFALFNNQSFRKVSFFINYLSIINQIITWSHVKFDPKSLFKCQFCFAFLTKKCPVFLGFSNSVLIKNSCSPHTMYLAVLRCLGTSQSQYYFLGDTALL